MGLFIAIDFNPGVYRRNPSKQTALYKTDNG